MAYTLDDVGKVLETELVVLRVNASDEGKGSGYRGFGVFRREQVVLEHPSKTVLPMPQYRYTFLRVATEQEYLSPDFGQSQVGYHALEGMTWD